MSNIVKEINMHIQAIQDEYKYLKLTKRQITLTAVFALHNLLRSRVLTIELEESGRPVLIEPIIKEV